MNASDNAGADTRKDSVRQASDTPFDACSTDLSPAISPQAQAVVAIFKNLPEIDRLLAIRAYELGHARGYIEGLEAAAKVSDKHFDAALAKVGA